MGSHAEKKFRPNFKFSRLNSFRESPGAVVVCASSSKSWSICIRRVKIWGGSTPQGPKCSIPKNVRLGGSIWATITLLFVDQSSPFFFIQRGRRCSWSNTFRICDMLIRSGDIRDQSWKLSKITPNFGRFFALPNFRGQAFQNLYPFYHSRLAARRLEKVLWGYSH